METGKDFLMSLQEIKEIYHRANFVEAPGGYLVGVYYHKAKPDSIYDKDGWGGLVFKQLSKNCFEYLSESSYIYRQSTNAIEWAYFMASEIRKREMAENGRNA